MKGIVLAVTAGCMAGVLLLYLTSYALQKSYTMGYYDGFQAGYNEYIKDMYVPSLVLEIVPAKKPNSVLIEKFKG